MVDSCCHHVAINHKCTTLSLLLMKQHNRYSMGALVSNTAKLKHLLFIHIYITSIQLWTVEFFLTSGWMWVSNIFMLRGVIRFLGDWYEGTGINGITDQLIRIALVTWKEQNSVLLNVILHSNSPHKMDNTSHE